MKDSVFWISVAANWCAAAFNIWVGVRVQRSRWREITNSVAEKLAPHDAIGLEP